MRIAHYSVHVRQEISSAKSASEISYGHLRSETVVVRRYVLAGASVSSQRLLPCHKA